MGLTVLSDFWVALSLYYLLPYSSSPLIFALFSTLILISSPIIFWDIELDRREWAHRGICINLYPFFCVLTSLSVSFQRRNLISLVIKIPGLFLFQVDTYISSLIFSFFLPLSAFKDLFHSKRKKIWYDGWANREKDEPIPLINTKRRYVFVFFASYTIHMKH